MQFYLYWIIPLIKYKLKGTFSEDLVWLFSYSVSKMEPNSSKKHDDETDTKCLNNDSQQIIQFFANAGYETIGCWPLYIFSLFIKNILAISLDGIKKPCYSEYMPIFPHVEVNIQMHIFLHSKALRYLSLYVVLFQGQLFFL